MKNLLLSLAMLLCISSAYAQLYVSPNAASSTDSYIFVSDQILYVEEDVNLVRNTNDPTTVSSIYLRDEAQMIQGSTGSSNSGTGWLSVYQESNSDAYDYNYWASPVGGSPSGTSGNRNFGMIRLADSLSVTNSEYAYYTYEHNGYSTPNLTISLSWFDHWDPTTQRWVWNGLGGSVAPGYGFTMKGTNVTTAADGTTVDQDANNQRYEFRGRPYNGDITVPVQTSAVPFTDGTAYYFTLSGNPYASALDLKDVFYDSDNTEIAEFHYWDEDRTVNSHYYIDNKGGYGTWVPGPVGDDANPGIYTRPTFMNYDNAGNPTTSTGVQGAIVQRRFAPIGQGFMIAADPLTPGDGSITIKNSHRQYVKEGAGNYSEHKIMENDGKNGANSFTSSSEDDSSSDDGGPTGTQDSDDLPTPIDYSNYTPQMRLHTVFGDDTHFRDMVLAFHDTATDGFDRGMDGRHPMDGSIAEAFMPIQVTVDGDSQTRPLVIQTVAFTHLTQMIPISFTLEEQMNVLLKVTEEINLPFKRAYLFDIEENTYEKITDGEDSSRILPAGLYKDRFYITFAAPKPGEDTMVDNAFVEAQNRLLENVDFVQNNPIAELQVNNPEGYDVKELSIFDMSGKLVLTKQNLGTQSSLRFPTGNFSDGVYLVRLTTVDNLKVDYKISVINK